MSKQIFLVKYILEEDIPIDESSNNIDRAFLPGELDDWLNSSSYLAEVNIREEAGEAPNLPVVMIKADETDDQSIKDCLNFVETKIFGLTNETSDLLKAEVIKNDTTTSQLDNLYIWLKIRNLLKEKKKNITNISLQLVIG